MGNGRLKKIVITSMIHNTSEKEMIEFGKEFLELIKYIEGRNYDNIEANRSEGGTYWEIRAEKSIIGENLR